MEYGFIEICNMQFLYGKIHDVNVGNYNFLSPDRMGNINPFLYIIITLPIKECFLLFFPNELKLTLRQML